jgi:hypothetical protein
MRELRPGAVAIDCKLVLPVQRPTSQMGLRIFGRRASSHDVLYRALLSNL